MKSHELIPFTRKFFILVFGHFSSHIGNILQGLIVSSRKESLQHFKKPWAHEHEPVKGLLDAVKVRTPSPQTFM